MSKINKQDLKSPDKLTQELQKGFSWTTQHSKLVLVAIVVLLLIGGGYSAFGLWDEHRETQIQEEYFKVEKDYFEKKDNFAQAEMLAASKDKNAQASAPAKATGDLEADYGNEIKEFTRIVDTYPRSKAAKMAALNLSDIYVSHGKSKEALDILLKVNSGSDLLSALVLSQLGTLQANNQDCQTAISTWNQALANKKASFLSGSLLLKQGLCYEAIGQTAQAEAAYTKAKESSQDTASAKNAEKYLRFLKVQ